MAKPASVPYDAFDGCAHMLKNTIKERDQARERVAALEEAVRSVAVELSEMIDNQFGCCHLHDDYTERANAGEPICVAWEKYRDTSRRYGIDLDGPTTMSERVKK